MYASKERLGAGVPSDVGQTAVQLDHLGFNKEWAPPNTTRDRKHSSRLDSQSLWAVPRFQGDPQ